MGYEPTSFSTQMYRYQVLEKYRAYEPSQSKYTGKKVVEPKEMRRK